MGWDFLKRITKSPYNGSDYSVWISKFEFKNTGSKRYVVIPCQFSNRVITALHIHDMIMHTTVIILVQSSILEHSAGKTKICTNIRLSIQFISPFCYVTIFYLLLHCNNSQNEEKRNPMNAISLNHTIFIHKCFYIW